MDRTRFARLAAGVAVAALVAGGTAACGSSSTPAPASSSAAGGNVLPPVIVEPDATTATAKVGDTIVFNEAEPAKTKITTDKPDILEVFPGTDDGSAQFNPGAKALKVGSATVTITKADGSTQTVAVTVTA